jgi:glutamate formiminotransferase
MSAPVRVDSRTNRGSLETDPVDVMTDPSGAIPYASTDKTLIIDAKNIQRRVPASCQAPIAFTVRAVGQSERRDLPRLRRGSHQQRARMVRLARWTATTRRLHPAASRPVAQGDPHRVQSAGAIV